MSDKSFYSRLEGALKEHRKAQQHAKDQRRNLAGMRVDLKREEAELEELEKTEQLLNGRVHDLLREYEEMRRNMK